MEKLTQTLVSWEYKVVKLKEKLNKSVMDHAQVYNHMINNYAHLLTYLWQFLSKSRIELVVL